MRVISGVARGCKLIAPSGEKTRPTGDRVKEDMFNILGGGRNSLRGLAFLDLYCGSGAVGIEALSRGAGRAVFVDYSRKAIAAVEANLEKTRLAEKAQLYCMPVGQAVEKTLSGSAFDVIFLDPPYNKMELVPLIINIMQGGLLANDGIIIAECPHGTKFPDNMQVIKQKKYAQMQIVFLEEGTKL